MALPATHARPALYPVHRPSAAHRSHSRVTGQPAQTRAAAARPARTHIGSRAPLMPSRSQPAGPFGSPFPPVQMPIAEMVSVTKRFQDGPLWASTSLPSNHSRVVGDSWRKRAISARASSMMVQQSCAPAARAF